MDSRARHTNISCGRDLCRLCGQSRPGLVGKRVLRTPIPQQGSIKLLGHEAPHVATVPTCLPGGKQDLQFLAIQTPVARPRGFTSASGFGHGPTTRANTRVLALRDKRVHFVLTIIDKTSTYLCPEATRLVVSFCYFRSGHIWLFFVCQTCPNADCWLKPHNPQSRINLALQ